MSDHKPEQPEPGKPVQIQITADEKTQAGHYCNLARISHNAEAFQLDFLVVHNHPPFGKLQSRVILTPGHAKRLLHALKENIDRYEQGHGTVRMSDPPTPDGYLQ